MDGLTLSEYRYGAGLTQKEMAALINNVTGMSYSANKISEWENNKREIPDYVVQAVLDIGAGSIPEGSSQDSSANGYDTDGFDPPPRRPDAAPGMPSGVDILPPLPSGQAGMEALCIEMFRGLGSMLELAGGLFGGPKVVADNTNPGAMITLIELDGRTITADSVKLGKAWAKLAEQNAWVAKILTSLTTGGAWVEVLAATSGTALTIYGNHAGYQRWLANQAAPQTPAEPEPEPPTL